MPVIYIRGRKAEGEVRLADILNLRNGDVLVLTSWRGEVRIRVLRRNKDRWVLNRKVAPSLIDEIIAWGVKS